MDEHVFEINRKRIERVIKALKNANMQAYYAKDRDEALQIAKSFLTNGDKVACGGSMTLDEIGLFDVLKNGGYDYFDRSRAGITLAQASKAYRDAFSADVYFTSTNAVTENGELVNVDGNANRVAAISFGPESVVIIAGVNKIVKDIDEAVARIKAVSAPANVHRLDRKGPCSVTGKCESCHSADCICCAWTVHRFSRIKDRIKVILVNECCGY